MEKFFEKYEIVGVTCNSKDVKSGYAFFAIKGKKFDGNNYIEDALKQGASVVFTDNASLAKEKVEYVQNARLGLAIAAGILYPKMPENMVAVTGTNGKSSVVSYVRQILSELGQKAAAIGTLGVESDLKLNLEQQKGAGLTTADPVLLRKYLQVLAENNVQNVAFEASSHGLDQSRLGDIIVKSAAFTSFSQDHLEYHKTMHDYMRAKLRLFTENLAEGGEAVLNSEMMFFDFVRKYLRDKNIPFFTVGKKGDLKIEKARQSVSGQEVAFSFEGKKYNFKTEIIGSFQATNILIAAKLVHNLGFDFGKIVSILHKLKAVKGRLERVTSTKDPYQIFVDYAHTPDALEKSLQELSALKGKSKLCVVFGCGGDRDKEKRPIMGKIASEIADRVIITDDNPRSEEPRKIRKEIVAGAEEKLEEIGGRKNAIEEAVKSLKKGDILLIAGKGHEEYQIIGNEVLEFSDVAVAKSSLRM